MVSWTSRGYLEAMQNFLDLTGASGATYRFQRIDAVEQLPAMAGNFVYVRGAGTGLTVACCGTEESLLGAATHWPAAVQAHHVEAIFVRLNVSWKVRSFEHEDIVKHHQPRMVIAAEFERLS